MAGKSVTVVLSQSPGRDPSRRALEEAIASALILEPTVEMSIVPNLYDMPADHSGVLFLRSIAGHLIVLSWHYPRATRWLLDRVGVHGTPGLSLLNPTNGEDDSDDEAEDELADESLGDEGENGIVEPPVAPGAAPRDGETPLRRIYCLDLREPGRANDYVAEIKRVAAELAVATVPLVLAPLAPQPPASDILPILGAGVPAPEAPNGQSKLRRRWYPLIDYDRCTNCLECIDFCLFGVYGIDPNERIIVEEQDNCKQGCPACSRVCPENAIIFPEYKSPAIAGGDDGNAGNLKIDLSLLFGGIGALQTAVVERDRELVQDGRVAVGMTAGIPKRLARRDDQPRDELDELVDQLDRLEL